MFNGNVEIIKDTNPKWEPTYGWRAPSRIGYAVPAGKRAHKTWKRRKASGRK